MPANDERFHLETKFRIIRDWRTVERIIKGATWFCLGIAGESEPYVVPLDFGYENKSFYFHSDLKGYKLDLLKKNKEVSFTIVYDVDRRETPRTPCRTIYKSVMGKGTAHFVEDIEEKIRGLKAIMRQSVGSEYDFPPERAKTVAIVRVDIKSATGRQAGH